MLAVFYACLYVNLYPHWCYYVSELNSLLTDELDAFLEDVKLSDVTSDFDDGLESKGLYIYTTYVFSNPTQQCTILQLLVLVETDLVYSVSWWWLEQASRNIETNLRTDSAVVQLITIL